MTFSQESGFNQASSSDNVTLNNQPIVLVMGNESNSFKRQQYQQKPTSQYKSLTNSNPVGYTQLYQNSKQAKQGGSPIDQKYQTAPLHSPPFNATHIQHSSLGQVTPSKLKDNPSKLNLAVRNEYGAPLPKNYKAPGAPPANLYRQSASQTFNKSDSERRNSSLGGNADEMGPNQVINLQNSAQKPKPYKKRVNPMMQSQLPPTSQSQQQIHQAQLPPQKLTRQAIMIAQQQKEALITSIYSQHQLSQYNALQQQLNQQYLAANGQSPMIDSRNHKKALQLTTNYPLNSSSNLNPVGGFVSSSSVGNLPKISNSQSVKHQNQPLAALSLNSHHGSNTRKPTLLAGSQISSVKQQHLQQTVLSQHHHNSQPSGGSLSSTGHQQLNVQQSLQNPPRKHTKKNSLSELYNIYMQPPNNFRSQSHSHQYLPTNQQILAEATQAVLPGGLKRAFDLGQSSIVEVSEASDSQNFAPLPSSQETMMLLDQQLKLHQKRSTGSPIRNNLVSQHHTGETLSENYTLPSSKGSNLNGLRLPPNVQAAQAQAQLLLNQQLQQLDHRQQQQPLNFAFSNSFNTSLVVQNALPAGSGSAQQLYDQHELDKLYSMLVALQDVYATMKTKQKKEIISEAFNSLGQVLKHDQKLSEMINLLGNMTQKLTENLITRKREVKREHKEIGEKLKNDMQELENQLFSSKVEQETLKIDKKYFEEQVQELQKKNQDLKSNIDSLKSETVSLQSKKGLQGRVPSNRSGIPLASSKRGSIQHHESLTDNNQKLLETLHKTIDQNTQLLEENALLNQHLDYARNKEGKLMYLIFKLHKRGYPVNQVFEAEVKAISTRRFANGNGGYQLLTDSVEGGVPEGQVENPDYQSAEYQDVKGESYIEFDSQASYSILELPKEDRKPRPKNVPALDFGELPVYISSESESEDNNHGAAGQGIPPKNQILAQKLAFQKQQPHQTHLSFPHAGGGGANSSGHAGANYDMEISSVIPNNSEHHQYLNSQKHNGEYQDQTDYNSREQEDDPYGDEDEDDSQPQADYTDRVSNAVQQTYFEEPDMLTTEEKKRQEEIFERQLQEYAGGDHSYYHAGGHLTNDNPSSHLGDQKTDGGNHRQQEEEQKQQQIEPINTGNMSVKVSAKGESKREQTERENARSKRSETRSKKVEEEDQ